MRVTVLTALVSVFCLSGCAASGGMQLGDQKPQPTVEATFGSMVLTAQDGHSQRARLNCRQPAGQLANHACQELTAWLQRSEDQRLRLSETCSKRRVRYEVQLVAQAGEQTANLSFSDTCQAARYSRALVALARSQP